MKADRTVSYAFDLTSESCTVTRIIRTAEGATFHEVGRTHAFAGRDTMVQRAISMVRTSRAIGDFT